MESLPSRKLQQAPSADPRRIYRAIVSLMRAAAKPMERGANPAGADVPLMQAAVAAYCADAPILPLRIETEAAAFALLVAWYGGRAPNLADDFVRLWGTVEGPLFAIAALDRAYRLHVELARRSGGGHVAVLTSLPKTGLRWPNDERPIPWRAVNDVAARLEEPTREAALAQVRALGPSAAGLGSRKLGSRGRPFADRAASATGKEDEDSAEADPRELPPSLREPSWRPRPSPRRAPLRLEPLPMDEKLDYRPGEREGLERPDLREDPANEEALLARIARSEAKAPDRASYEHLARLPRATLSTLLTSLDPARLGTFDIHYLPLIVARAGESALAFALKAFPLCPEEGVVALSRASSARVALPMAEVFARNKLAKARAVAQTWLEAFPEAAAVGLLPIALGKQTAAREAAVVALKHLVSTGSVAILEEVASRYGQDAVAALHSLLFEAGAAATKTSKIPGFIEAKQLPRPRLASGGKAIPLETLEAIIVLLVSSPLETLRPELADVRGACDASSLAALAWSIARLWNEAGRPMPERWALDALAHLGDDGCAARLASLVGAWVSEKDDAHATLGVDVLAQIGTRQAISHLRTLARSAKGKIKTYAQAKLDEVAATHLLTPDELAELLLPDAARLEKDAVEQIERFERAMCEGRRWSHASFRGLLAEPLLATAARKLVWGAFDAAGARMATFEIAGDGALLDAGRSPFFLPEASSVELVHPIDLDEATSAAWRAIIPAATQPFPQLARSIARLRPEERHRDGLDPFVTNAKTLQRVLRRRGWQLQIGHGVVNDFFALDGASKRLTLSIGAGISFPPQRSGTASLYKLHADEPIVAQVWLYRETPWLLRPHVTPLLAPPTFADVPDAILSELLCDLREVRSAGGEPPEAGTRENPYRRYMGVD